MSAVVCEPKKKVHGVLHGLKLKMSTFCKPIFQFLAVLSIAKCHVLTEHGYR